MQPAVSVFSLELRSPLMESALCIHRMVLGFQRQDREQTNCLIRSQLQSPFTAGLSDPRRMGTASCVAIGLQINHSVRQALSLAA
jgi:hypothetical protein